MSQDVQVVDNGTTAQIEEILAQSPIACASSLPVTNMCEAMLHCHPFTQLSSSLRGLLALTQLDEQGFIGKDAHTASLGTGGALAFQGALDTGVLGKVDHPTKHKGHFLLRGTLDRLP